MNAFDSYYKVDINFNMFNLCQLNKTWLRYGYSKADLIDLGLYTYTFFSSTTKKITLKIGAKALSSAVLDWQAQVLINMISGQTYEQAISNIKVEPIFWDAMSSIITNTREELLTDCIKATVDRIQETKEFNMTGVKEALFYGCTVETIKNGLLWYLFDCKKGPYSHLLKQALKNKSYKELRLFFEIHYKMKPEQIDDILRFIPKQFVDGATQKINIP